MATGRASGFLIQLRKFRYSIAALSAVEFAVILPVMLMLYLGGTEVTQAITIKRKTTVMTRSIGDLVAQGVKINDAEMQGIFSATAAVISPYPTQNLKIVVSSIAIDEDGNATIAWSEGHQTAKRVHGSPITLPDGLAVPNTHLILAEGEYEYTPPIGYVITGSISLKDHNYLRPRNVNTVCRVTGGQEIC